MALLAILTSLGAGYYWGFVKGVEAESTGSAIMADLKTARAKAMSGEDEYNWGVHFSNSADDYYELFSTPTDYASASIAIKSKTYLEKGVVFSNPAEGFNKDVIFGKISGTSSPASVVISADSGIQTINITAIGGLDKN